MGKIKLYDWDAARHLKTEADIEHYLQAAFKDGDPALITAALGDVARARGMSQVAKKAGVNRESLYKALSKNRKPYFETITNVINALGFNLRVSARKAA